jgi:hypothetical protein
LLVWANPAFQKRTRRSGLIAIKGEKNGKEKFFWNNVGIDATIRVGSGWL